MKVKIRGKESAKVLRFNTYPLREHLSREEELAISDRYSEEAVYEHNRLLIKNMNNLFETTYEEAPYFIDTGKVREWNDEIDIMSIDRIIIEGESYKVYHVTLDEDGYYVLDTGYEVPTDKYYEHSQYEAVANWLSLFYPDVDSFSELATMQFSPCGLELEVEEYDRMIESRDLEETLDSYIEDAKIDKDYATAEHKFQYGLYLTLISIVISVVVYWRF